MIVSEALKIAVTKNTGIYRKDKYPRAEGIVIPTNTKHGCIFIWKYQGYSKIILNWSPCASDILSDQWEVYEVLDSGLSDGQKGEKPMQETIKASTTQELLDELKRRGAVQSITVGVYQPYELIAKYGATPISDSVEVLIVEKQG